MASDKTLSEEELLGYEQARSKFSISLRWKDICFRGVQKDKGIFKRYFGKCFPPTTPFIVNNASGYIKPGRFLGIIGPSGAGKTTLLKILANQQVNGTRTGEFTANGVPIKQHISPSYRKHIAFVHQTDTNHPFLTARETLFYAGMIGLPRSMSYDDKLQRIETTLNILGITSSADTLVGKLSGGERKRISIAVELLQNPSILFLDEPTSGLDASTSLQVVARLQNLVRYSNYAIVCCIHQPRKQIFGMFDDLLLLSSGGKPVYFGPADSALTYFDVNDTITCPMSENPADHLIDRVAIDDRSSEADRESLLNLQNTWAEREASEEEEDADTHGLGGPGSKRKKATWPAQVFWLAHREFLGDLRDYSFLLTRFLQNFIVAFVLGWAYFRLGNDQSTIADRTGFIYFVIVVISFHEMVAAITVFSRQRAMFDRERDSGLYSISAFWVGKQIALLPSQFFFPAVFVFSCYWSSGLQVAWYKFIIFFGFAELVGFYCSSLGLVFSVAFLPSYAITLGPLTNVYSSIAIGFLVRLDSIPVPLRYFTYLSYAQWAYDAMVQNEFMGLNLTCTNGQINQGHCPYDTGEEALESLDITGFPFIADLFIIALMTLFFRILLFFALKYTGAQTKGR